MVPGVVGSKLGTVDGATDVTVDDAAVGTGYGVAVGTVLQLAPRMTLRVALRHGNVVGAQVGIVHYTNDGSAVGFCTW